MRTYGRVNGSWQEVSTSATGDDSMVWLTTLAQVLKLQLGESPFFGDYGIDVYGSLSSQIPPDYYIQKTVSKFSQYFISLTVNRTFSGVNPSYNITAILPSGAITSVQVPI